MRNVFLFIVFSFVLAFNGCTKLNSKNKVNDFYSLKSEKVKNGFTIAITPKKGFKWNKEYPFKLKINESKGAVSEKEVYNKSDINLKDKTAQLNVNCKDNTCEKSKTKISFTGTVNFSLCNETQCKIFRNKKIILK